MYNFNLIFRNPYNYEIQDSYRMVSNYSLEDITKAYKEASDIIGVDFIKQCYREYEDFYLDEETTKMLVDHGILNKEYVEINDLCEGEYYIEDANNLIDVFKNIIKLVLKDFEWKERDLNETTLNLLDYYK